MVHQTADKKDRKRLVGKLFKQTNETTSTEYILLVAVVATIIFKFKTDIARRFRIPAVSCGESYSCRHINPKYEHLRDFPIESKLDSIPKSDKMKSSKLLTYFEQSSLLLTFIIIGVPGLVRAPLLIWKFPISTLKKAIPMVIKAF